MCPRSHANPPNQSWDALYATELTNHSTNPSDEGTVWFDDSDAEAKLVSFLDAHAASSETTSSPLHLSKRDTSFLDLGCGNGSLLFALRDEDWEGRLLGVDYSEASVALAVRVGEGRRRRAQEEEEEEEEEDNDEEEAEEQEDGEEKMAGVPQDLVDSAARDTPVSAPAPGGKKVDFMVWDVLAGPLDAVRSDTNKENGDLTTAGWDVVLDKGTFDAVSLSEQRDEAGRRICEGYRDRVLQLLRPGGIFLVTSCNWTEPELRGWFEGDGSGGAGRLRQVDKVEYRSFSFGGVKGQTISTVCFMKE
jgi:SAM-dependent methyltransferase